MSPFPCPLERTVASALLLLSEKPPSLSPLEPPPHFCSGYSNKSKESLVLANSKSCSSSLTSGGSSEEFQAHRRRIVAAVARCHEMKLKVVRKSRSKTRRSSDGPKMTSDKLATITPGCLLESTEGSCLSSGSSAISSARSCCVAREGNQGASARVGLGRKPMSSTHMHRRAESILKLLSGGCASEVRIRHVLGDSPDTSKALRMLLKLEEVKRSGAGGRADPYIYRIAR